MGNRALRVGGRRFVNLADGGEIHIDPRYLRFLRELERTRAGLGGEARFALEADLAHAAQKLLEEAVLHLVRFGCGQTGLRSLCLAGGVALNAVANARILEETAIERIFVQPAANDAGIAIGAASHTYYARSGMPREFVLEHAYLGRSYDDEEIDAALAGFRGRRELEQPIDLCERAAGLLADGKVVAWFQGGSEFGRARWATARSSRIRARRRRGSGSTRSSNASGSVRSRLRCLPRRRPSISSYSRLHGLIAAFADRTGVPVLLNTSFNIQGPIVETPADAVETFVRSDLDVLVVGDYLLHRDAATAAG